MLFTLRQMSMLLLPAVSNQVEELRCPQLAGRPVAIQQHQDVIAVNYPARQAGVKKHMQPAQVR
jgi:nucleotidyltransferase/DNA polymerase involved in DNA repair